MTHERSKTCQERPIRIRQKRIRKTTLPTASMMALVRAVSSVWASIVLKTRSSAVVVLSPGVPQSTAGPLRTAATQGHGCGLMTDQAQFLGVGKDGKRAGSAGARRAVLRSGSTMAPPGFQPALAAWNNRAERAPERQNISSGRGRSCSKSAMAAISAGDW